MKNKLLIIDGNSLANRAFYALPYLTNSKGEFTGAVFGFVNMLVKVVKEEQPSHIVVAFDYGRKTFRNSIFEAYKGTRKQTPPELISQFKMLKNVLGAMGIVTIEKEGIEADDIIGTITKNTSFESVILSGDRDVFQLIDEKTSVMMTKKGISETQTVTKDNMFELYEHTPEKVVDLKALMGDASDNIPGIAGIGPKTALKLLSEYDTLEKVLENAEKQTGSLKEKLVEGRELALVSKQLATIKTNCDLGAFDISKTEVKFPLPTEAAQVFKELDFGSLLSRKDLFAENALVETATQKPVKAQKISTLDELKKVVQGFSNAQKFSFDLINTHTIAVDENQNFDLDFDLNLFSEGLLMEDVLSALKGILEDEKVHKITNFLKDHLHLFSKANITLKGKVFDLGIAEYLVDAGIKTSNEISVASKNFSKAISLEKQMTELGLLSLYETVELPLAFVLADMEEEGFKIDTKALDELSEKYSAELEQITQMVHKFAGREFNLNSPKQLGEVLFDQLNLKAYGNTKKSTGIEVLNAIADQHEIVPLIIRYRKLFKLLSTYVESYRNIVSKSGDIIHTVFNQTLTSTGRLSSSEPNLQNIPIRDDEGKALRKIFISKHENGLIVSADYNQIELRLLANFSGDENMTKAYKNNEDIHTLTASQIFGVPQSAVSSAMRREAKAVNFGIVYGISDYGLSVSIGSTRKTAKDYIDKYFETYSGIKTYLDGSVQTARETGMVKTLYGRIRKVPEVLSSRFNLRQFGERVAMNVPLQGSAADIIKVAMIKVFETFKEKGLKSRLILQVHDELVVDTHPSEVEKVKQILVECMENVVKLEVPLPAVVSSGKTWFDC